MTGVARGQGAFVLYLACFLVGQTFLSFQWDILLLEAGFLTILYAPLVPKSREPAPAPATWLLRVLLFKCVGYYGTTTPPSLLTCSRPGGTCVLRRVVRRL